MILVDYELNNWIWGEAGTIEMRLYPESDFTDADGNEWAGQGAYIAYPCSVAGTVLTPTSDPVIPNTVDSPDNPSVRYALLAICQNNVQRIAVLSDFIVPNSFPDNEAPIEVLKNYNRARPNRPGAGYLDADQTNVAIQAAVDAIVAGETPWGSITGTLANQADLNTALTQAKARANHTGQQTAATISDFSSAALQSVQPALDNKVTKNEVIAGRTATKVTFDAKGLVTDGTDATTADIADTNNKRYATEAEKTKLGFITVTQAVDLDDIESRVNDLDAAVVLKGAWDASTGAFPGGGAAQAGWSYIVSVGGTVNGVAFNANDRIIAITDNASTTTFANNWFKADYTDQFLSLDGQTGTVTLGAVIAALSSKTTPHDSDSVGGTNSESSNASVRFTFANLKTWIQNFYNSVTATLTNKTISLANNTLTGTKAQFNAALSDADFATLGGTEELTNKTIVECNTDTSSGLGSVKVRDDNFSIFCGNDLTQPSGQIVKFTVPDTGGNGTRTMTLPPATTTLVGINSAQTLTNKTISGANNTLSNIAQSAVTNLVNDLAAKVAGPASSVSGNFATFNGTDGKTVQDGGNLGGIINGLTAKTTPVAADTLAISDSAASNAPKKVTFANFWAAIIAAAKAAVSVINTGTDDATLITPLGLAGSKYLDQSGGKIYATASGTNTYAATISPAITAYAAGQRFHITFTNANTGAATINLNSLGAKSIVKNGSTALASGDIAAGMIGVIVYDGTNFQLTNPKASGSSTPGFITHSHPASPIALTDSMHFQSINITNKTVNLNTTVTDGFMIFISNSPTFGAGTIFIPNGVRIFYNNATALGDADGSTLTMDGGLILIKYDTNEWHILGANGTLTFTA